MNFNGPSANYWADYDNDGLGSCTVLDGNCLPCEEDPECSDTKDFNILSGAGSLASTDVASILGTMGSVAAQAAADVAGQVAAGVGIPVPSASDLDNLGSLVNFISSLKISEREIIDCSREFNWEWS